MIYKFKAGIFNGCDPQKVGETLEQIRITNGGKLKTEDVVLAAADSESPLHPAFTWDDTQAAHRWRLSEAQYLVRHVVVIAAEDAAPQKAFYHVVLTEENQSGDSFYQSHSVLAQNPKQYAAALREVIGDLAGAEASLERLQRLAPRPNRVAVRRATEQVAAAHKTLVSQSP